MIIGLESWMAGRKKQNIRITHTKDKKSNIPLIVASNYSEFHNLSSSGITALYDDTEG